MQAEVVRATTTEQRWSQKAGTAVPFTVTHSFVCSIEGKGKTGRAVKIGSFLICDECIQSIGDALAADEKAAAAEQAAAAEVPAAQS